VSRHITFIVCRDSLGAVFDSIALAPAANMRRRGCEADIVCMAPVGEYVRPALRKRWQDRMNTAEQKLPGGLNRIPVSPSRFSRWLDDSQPLARWMRRIPDDRLLICCGAPAAYSALKARRKTGSSVRLIFYSLGPIAEEFALARAGAENAALSPEDSARREVLRAWEHAAYVQSDAVICISQAMKNHAAGLRGGNDRIVLIPCVTDTAFFCKDMSVRHSVRSKMGWESRLVVVFCGAVHAWQEMDALIRCFKIIKSVEPEALFLLLPHRTAGLERLLGGSGINAADYALVQTIREEVPEWLAAADIGLIGRGLFKGLTRVNGFSSPIKAGEYLAAGLPIIMSEGVGDASELVRRTRTGCVLPAYAAESSARNAIAEFLGQLNADPENLRKRCLETAREHLDIQLYGNALEELIGKLT